MIDHIEATLDYESDCKYRVLIAYDLSRGGLDDYAKTFVVVKESRLLGVVFDDEDVPVEDEQGKRIFKQLWDAGDGFQCEIDDVLSAEIDRLGVFNCPSPEDEAGWDQRDYLRGGE